MAGTGRGERQGMTREGMGCYKRLASGARPQQGGQRAPGHRAEEAVKWRQNTGASLASFT